MPWRPESESRSGTGDGAVQFRCACRRQPRLDSAGVLRAAGGDPRHFRVGDDRDTPLIQSQSCCPRTTTTPHPPPATALSPGFSHRFASRSVDDRLAAAGTSPTLVTHVPNSRGVWAGRPLSTDRGPCGMGRFVPGGSDRLTGLCAYSNDNRTEPRHNGHRIAEHRIAAASATTAPLRVSTASMAIKVCATPGAGGG